MSDETPCDEIISALGAAEYHDNLGTPGKLRLTEWLRALVRRDWAVRVLDAAGDWDCLPGPRVTHPDSVVATGQHFIQRNNPDAARLAAAEAVWPELPESERARIGEKP